MKAHLMVVAVGMLMVAGGVAQAVAPKDAPGQPAVANTRLSPSQREAIVDRIVRRWGPFVQQVHKTSIGAWTTRMQGTFAAANDGNLQRAATMNTFQGMMDALVGQHLTDNQVMDSLVTQAQVLKAGPVPALLGSTTSDLVYTPLAPCRIADTRVIGGPIAHGTVRSFHGYTGTNFSGQGGIAGSNCGIPANPSALMINVAAPNPTQSGYLTVWPYGTAMPLASNLDYKAGDLANNEIAAKMTIGSSSGEFSVFAFGTTNVVIDAVGYFMAPQATPVDCTTVAATPVTVPDTFTGVGRSALPSCPATYTQVSVGCSTVNSEDLLIAVDSTFGCAAVDRDPGNAFTGTIQSTITCCRVPGR